MPLTRSATTAVSARRGNSDTASSTIARRIAQTRGARQGRIAHRIGRHVALHRQGLGDEKRIARGECVQLLGAAAGLCGQTGHGGERQGLERHALNASGRRLAKNIAHGRTRIHLLVPIGDQDSARTRAIRRPRKRMRSRVAVSAQCTSSMMSKRGLDAIGQKSQHRLEGANVIGVRDQKPRRWRARCRAAAATPRASTGFRRLPNRPARASRDPATKRSVNAVLPAPASAAMATIRPLPSRACAKDSLKRLSCSSRSSNSICVPSVGRTWT